MIYTSNANRWWLNIRESKAYQSTGEPVDESGDRTSRRGQYFSNV